jgi:hypothetical protein
MYHIQHEVLIIPVSPTIIDVKEKHCKVGDYFNLTALANGYNWQIKNSHFLLVLVEGSLYLSACLQAQSDFGVVGKISMSRI